MISPEDYSAICDFLGRYFWCVNENKIDEWGALWTDDGTVLSSGMEPIVGREALRAILRSFDRSEGQARRTFSNTFCDYGVSRDMVIVHYDELVTNWGLGGSLQAMAVCKALLVRDGPGWKVQRSEVTILR